MSIDGIQTEALIDSGAWLTLISNKVFDQKFKERIKLRNANVIPGDYGGKTIELKGFFEAEIEF